MYYQPGGNYYTQQTNLQLPDRMNRVRTPMQMYVQQVIQNWNDGPKNQVLKFMKKYGLPDEATPRMMIWYNNEPWKRTVIYKETVLHNFPKKHVDFIEQTISYRVPIHLYDNIARFDGSIILDRTKGEVTARCDNEAMNYAALNIMHEIVTRKRTEQEARDYLAKTVKEYENNEPTPYTEGFLFKLPTKKTADPDKAVL
ncbi:hypothetical protein ACSVDA_19625 [Cytobacillus sp. Hm23]